MFIVLSLELIVLMIDGLLVQEVLFGFFSIQPTTPLTVCPLSKVTCSVVGQLSPGVSFNNCTIITPPFGAIGSLFLATISSIGIPKETDVVTAMSAVAQLMK